VATEPDDPIQRRSLLEREHLRASRLGRAVRERAVAPAARLAERHPVIWRRAVAPALTASARVSSDALGIQAGSLTYGAVLSIPPLLLIAMSIASAFLRDHQEATDSIIRAITDAVPGATQVVNANLELRNFQQLGIGLIGLVTVIWTASGFAARARHAFGVVFQTERTGLVAGRISAALLGTPIVLLFVGLAVVGGLSAGRKLFGGLPYLADLAGILGVVAVSFLFVLLTYRLLTPGRGPTLREHVPGSLVFAAGWLGLHVLGAAYVSQVVTRTTALYGTVGALFGLFAFLYLTMWLLLLGAEISQAYRAPARSVVGLGGLPERGDAR
jgi:membrane protein